MSLPSSTPAADPQREASPYTALLSVANPEVFRTNSFRITGLTVDTTARGIAKHADKLKMMEELGHGRSAHTGAFALEPPPTLDQIRTAIQNLKDPEIRLLNEFFWFWPKEFGQSPQDPAIQALIDGDQETALDIWMTRETVPATAMTATHNIAVLWLLVALDWEEYASRKPIDGKSRRQIEEYWRDSFKRWELLSGDESFWKSIATRISLIDDPRLKISFAAEMRETLPRALDKINAELAIRYAERGQLELARVHVQLMRETRPGLQSIQEAADLVLAPARARLKQHLERAQQPHDAKAGENLTAARELLAQAQKTFVLFDLFYGTEDSARVELAEELAGICDLLLVAHYNATKDDANCLELSKSILANCRSLDLRDRLERNMAVYRAGPLIATLETIEKSKAAARNKLQTVKKRVLPALSKLTAGEGKLSTAATKLSDRVAHTLRSIAIAANNDDNDFATAIDSLEAAQNLAQDAALKKQITEDQFQIKRTKNDIDRGSLRLKIRLDTIEVTAQKIRRNFRSIRCADITGVRLGIGAQDADGKKTPVSYRIDIRSGRGRNLSIPCKPLLRDEKKAAADFLRIVRAIDSQIVPFLCVRITRSILEDQQQIAFGDCLLTKDGIQLTSGFWFWKKKQTIGWFDLRYTNTKGRLIFYSERNSKLSRSCEIGDVWNASIFGNLVQTITSVLRQVTPTIN